jgi:quinol monooxygenase YgiN
MNKVQNDKKTVLDADASYLTFINTFTVKEDQAEALLLALKSSTEEIFSKQAGFISANLHVSDDKTRIVNYAQWASKAAYEAARQLPVVQAHIKELAKLVISFEPCNYTLRYSIGAD